MGTQYHDTRHEANTAILQHNNNKWIFEKIAWFRSNTLNDDLPQIETEYNIDEKTHEEINEIFFTRLTLFIYLFVRANINNN